MRPSTFVLCLAVSSLASASAETASGVCGLTITCAQNTSTPSFRACSANETADFKLVSTALQSCKDVSYYSSQGQPWPINSKPVYCALDSVCGKLVPYLRNTAYLSEVCDAFSPFADTIATFRDYCRGEPVQQLESDNGLLRDLELSNGTNKATPAPTTRDNYRSGITFPADRVSSRMSGTLPVVAPTALLAATLTAAAVHAIAA